jgi:Family of unknown function (DUF5329)
MWPQFATGLLICLSTPGVQNDSPPTETQKIESLISHIESLQDAKFVRNGVAYDAETAGQFLRGKWKAQQSDIKTAQDFIDKAASKSSTTGQPYLIRQPDGKEIKSGEYLIAELRKIETKK